MNSLKEKNRGNFGYTILFHIFRDMQGFGEIYAETLLVGAMQYNTYLAAFKQLWKNWLNLCQDETPPR